MSDMNALFTIYMEVKTGLFDNFVGTFLKKFDDYKTHKQEVEALKGVFEKNYHKIQEENDPVKQKKMQTAFINNVIKGAGLSDTKVPELTQSIIKETIYKTINDDDRMRNRYANLETVSDYQRFFNDLTNAAPEDQREDFELFGKEAMATIRDAYNSAEASERRMSVSSITVDKCFLDKTMEACADCGIHVVPIDLKDKNEIPLFVFDQTQTPIVQDIIKKVEIANLGNNIVEPEFFKTYMKLLSNTPPSDILMYQGLNKAEAELCRDRLSTGKNNMPICIFPDEKNPGKYNLIYEKSYALTVNSSLIHIKSELHITNKNLVPVYEKQCNERERFNEDLSNIYLNGGKGMIVDGRDNQHFFELYCPKKGESGEPYFAEYIGDQQQYKISLNEKNRYEFEHKLRDKIAQIPIIYFNKEDMMQYQLNPVEFHINKKCSEHISDVMKSKTKHPEITDTKTKEHVETFEKAMSAFAEYLTSKGSPYFTGDLKDSIERMTGDYEGLHEGFHNYLQETPRFKKVVKTYTIAVSDMNTKLPNNDKQSNKEFKQAVDTLIEEMSNLQKSQMQYMQYSTNDIEVDNYNDPSIFHAYQELKEDINIAQAKAQAMINSQPAAKQTAQTLIKETQQAVVTETQNSLRTDVKKDVRNMIVNNGKAHSERSQQIYNMLNKAQKQKSGKSFEEMTVDEKKGLTKSLDRDIANKNTYLESKNRNTEDLSRG